MNTHRKINISEMPKYEFIGYLWWSNEPDPTEYHTPQNIEIICTDLSNPFIIEGQLYSKKEKKSYSLKYTDGKHIVIEYDLEELDKFEKKEQKYIPNKIKASKIIFSQYWIPEEDKFCCHMKILIPGPFVFTGFECNKKEKEVKS